MIYSCDIAYQVDIPASTRMGHQGMGVVMHPATIIGENCTILQHATFGATFGEDQHKVGAPILGNDVLVCAGAVIIGPIKIGNNVTIGANAVVNRDVPDNVVVAGIPARIVKYK